MDGVFVSPVEKVEEHDWQQMDWQTICERSNVLYVDNVPPDNVLVAENQAVRSFFSAFDKDKVLPDAVLATVHERWKVFDNLIQHSLRNMTPTGLFARERSSAIFVLIYFTNNKTKSTSDDLILETDLLRTKQAENNGGNHMDGFDHRTFRIKRDNTVSAKKDMYQRGLFF